MVGNPHDIDATDATQSRAAMSAQYSFHVLPPSSIKADSTPGHKGKRRRTSPRDHAILEAAYLKNSKPDKIERALIVSQVELGEKEVQIWFQNRRQNDRRKSKPLQPHELVAHLRAHSSSPDARHIAASSPRDDGPIHHVNPSQTLAPIESLNRPASRASSIHDLLNPPSSAETISSTTGISELSSQAALAPSTPPSSLEEQAKVISSEIEEKKKVVESKRHEEGSEQGSAKKRDHDEMAGVKEKPIVNGVDQPGKDQPRVKEPLARSSSMVRLAMTVDGAVKIRTDNEPTPSPEKPRAQAPPTGQGNVRSGLARSKSAMNDADVFRQSSQSQPKAVGAGFGRSRDARTWEFYCDSTAKDALSIQAEAEAAGSAVSAINLVRSNSFKSRVQALSPALSKNNARIPQASKTGKAKLMRAQSSLGRLQGYDGASEKPADGSKPRHIRSPSGDSDKENWAPGTRASINPLRRTEPSVHSRPVLHENGGIIFRDAAPSSQEPRHRGVGAAAAQPSPSKDRAKGEELDCVQGLLSLSQGAWR